MAADVFTLETINATLGALETGVLICMFLLGASTVQVHVYYSRFPKDDWRIKILVSLIHCIISGAFFPRFLTSGCFSPVRRIYTTFCRTTRS
jgi:predicted membrane-bound mannosyltransferase